LCVLFDRTGGQGTRKRRFWAAVAPPPVISALFPQHIKPDLFQGSHTCNCWIPCRILQRVCTRIFENSIFLIGSSRLTLVADSLSTGSLSYASRISWPCYIGLMPENLCVDDKNLFFQTINSLIFSNPLLLHTTGILLALEIQRGKLPMRQQAHQDALGSTAACTRRLCESVAYSGVKLPSRREAAEADEAKRESFLGLPASASLNGPPTMATHTLEPSKLAPNSLPFKSSLTRWLISPVVPTLSWSAPHPKATSSSVLATSTQLGKL
jgi:hypothetical protein